MIFYNSTWVVINGWHKICIENIIWQIILGHNLRVIGWVAEIGVDGKTAVQFEVSYAKLVTCISDGTNHKKF